MAEDDKEKKTREEDGISAEKLPEVLILDILSRLPVKSLLRFRCVCKSWCSAITDSDFIKMHLSRSHETNNLSLIFCDDYNDTLFSLDLDACKHKDTVEIVEDLVELKERAVELDHPFMDAYLYCMLPCNGLLCMFDEDCGFSFSDTKSPYDTFLWNPFTRRHKKLPRPTAEFPIDASCRRGHAFGFGYDSTTDDYKFVRVVDICTGDGLGVSEVIVYSLSTNSWRRIENIPYLNIEDRFGVCTNSAFHWVARCQTGSVIVSIDLKNDEYREVPLPHFLGDKFHMGIGVLGGQLSMICNYFPGEFCAELWVMKDYGVRDSWAKQFSIETPVLRYLYEYIRPVCYSKNGEILLETTSEVCGFLETPPTWLWLYDPHKERARRLVIGFFQKTVCIDSLVPLDSKDETEYEKRREKSNLVE